MNKKQLLFTVMMVCATVANAQIVKGLRTPQLTPEERNTISAIDANMAKGQVVYNTDSNCLEFWDGSRWRNFCESTGWFYMPSVVFDVSTQGSGFTMDLYQEYKKQLNTAGGLVVGSTSAPGKALDTVPEAADLYYYVTAYDDTVFDGITISDSGVMTYDIIGVATDATFINIVFVEK